MPELSRFLGIVIAMYYRDHGPPHFHAIYGDFEITVEIESGKVNGDFPRRALAHMFRNGGNSMDRSCLLIGISPGVVNR